MGSNLVLRVTLVAVLLSSAPSALAQLRLQVFEYSAQTTQTARQQGDVVAGGITWACQGRTCATRGPWPNPGVEACRALAAQVGPISAYGRAGAMLSATDLAACNGSSSAPRIIMQAPLPPSAVARTRGPVTITTPELSLVGGATVDTRDRSAPSVVITTPDIYLVGGASVDTSDRAAPPVTITTPELVFVGR